MTCRSQSCRFGMLGAFFAATAVGAGAFGAHALKTIVSPSSLAIYETAVRYQMYHAIGLFVVAWLCHETTARWVAKAGWLFFVGILLFSGSLYMMALGGIPWMGAVTPLGGLAFVAGWLCIAWTLWRAA